MKPSDICPGPPRQAEHPPQVYRTPGCITGYFLLEVLPSVFTIRLEWSPQNDSVKVVLVFLKITGGMETRRQLWEARMPPFCWEGWWPWAVCDRGQQEGAAGLPGAGAGLRLQLPQEVASRLSADSGVEHF